MTDAAETRSSALQRFVDEVLRTLITFVFAVLFATVLSHVFGRECDVPDQPSPILQGVRDFSPSEIIVVYFHSLGWYNSSFPPLNRLLDMTKTPEYRQCTLGNVDLSSDRAMRMPGAREAWCDYVARGQRKEVDLSTLGPLGPLTLVTALINVVVYEFYAKSGALLVAVYAQLLVGLGLGLMILQLLLCKGVVRLEGNGNLAVACVALAVSSILLGSLAAAILQYLTEEIIVGAWFTAPFRFAEFLAHGPIEWLSHRITMALRR